jgi:hypothetical protein
MSFVSVAALPLDMGTLAMRRSEKWADQPAGVLASTIAEMDFELAEPVLAALRAALDRHDLGYTPSRIPGLAAAFAGFAGRRMGWGVDPEQVVPVTDVMIGVASLCRALTEPGDSVAFASPNYPPFLTELSREGLQLCEVGLRPDGALNLDALERTLAGGTRVLVLTSPHNPTGRVLPRPELEAIAEICADHDAWVIADEIHAPLTLAGATFTAWLEVSDAARERGVSVTSASKAFNLAALKCALAITASGRARDALRRLGDPSDHVGRLEQVSRGSRLHRRRPVAGRAPDPAGHQPEPAEREAGRRAAQDLLDAASGVVHRLAGLPRPRPRRRSRRRLPAPRRRAQPGPSLRFAGRRLRATQLRHQPGARHRDRQAHGARLRQLSEHTEPHSLPRSVTGIIHPCRAASPVGSRSTTSKSGAAAGNRDVPGRQRRGRRTPPRRRRERVADGPRCRPRCQGRDRLRTRDRSPTPRR